jgi:hypothetical protein
MAGSWIERTSRPMPSGSPTGAATLMPPHIQGAERRAGRRARWGLRALVIGGLTGAAWLLTGAAAQTTEREAEPARPAVTHEQGGTTVDATVPLEVAGPARLTGGPVDLRQRLVTVPASAPRSSRLSTADPVGEHPVVRRPGDDRPVGTPEARASSPRAHPAFRTGRSFMHSKAAHRRPAVASATADGPVRDRRGTHRAPLRPYHGESGGSAAMGPATSMEGGCAAFLPAAIADSTMACHPLPITTDAGARRHDAEAPTVSPD